MNRPTRAPLPDPTIKLTEGWHCLHIYYSLNRLELDRAQRSSGPMSDEAKAEFVQVLNPETTGVERIQLSVTSGHKADFGLMVLDPDPLAVDRVHQAVLSSKLGPYLQPTYSFVSITEISEYVPTVEQYTERLKREGTAAEAIEVKAKRYADHLPSMNQRRLYPDIPELPVVCFYPMNKWRYPGANWFQLSSEERHKLMSEHARSGIKFAGKVSQLITVGVGLDDWEWGVTLWATNPMHLKQIVYDMRFDEASAKYAEFGPFYTTYVCSAEKVLAVCGV